MGSGDRSVISLWARPPDEMPRASATATMDRSGYFKVSSYK
jgi:hypothetical protein